MVEKTFQNVLLLNGDSATTRLLLEVLTEAGVRATVVHDTSEAANKLTEYTWDLVLLDSPLVNKEVLTHLGEARRNDPELLVVALSDENSATSAVKTMKLGFTDLLVKPIDRKTFQQFLSSVLPNRDVPMAAADEEDTRCLYQIAGQDERLLGMLELARKVAPTSAPILLIGESGTGKELVSYYLHRESQRSRGPYLRVNCAAFSESLLESELFGHERGAFTGAYARRKGLFERAHGGTLLLDEISETTSRLQAELLRVIEHQDFERVGGSEPVHVNVRVISTSNKDLAAEVENGRFRRDLYYRICGLRLYVPPLRERKGDIEILVWHFVNLYAKEAPRRITKLDEQMMDLFETYHWPGNVRQLRNIVRTALILGEGRTLSLDGAPHLLSEVQSAPSSSASEILLQDVERQAILEALRRTNSHQTKAAKLLGITDRTLREKLRRYRNEGRIEAMGEKRWQRETV